MAVLSDDRRHAMRCLRMAARARIVGGQGRGSGTGELRPATGPGAVGRHADQSCNDFGAVALARLPGPAI